jgi:tRNA modification GTPase
MKASGDTIAAIATSLGEAGIAIVRISGPDTYRIADAVFQCNGNAPSLRPPGTFIHGYVSKDNKEIDEALLLIMRAPNTYTREDMVEIQGHGGPVSARRVLRTVLDQGARLAEPGEFTRRAFMNGRIDLLQAEAVLDLIHARSERAAQAAIEQLEGGLSHTLNSLYDELISISADLEAALDFPEEDIPVIIMQQQVRRIESLLQSFNALIQSWDEGHLLRDGILAVISGRPNVGKSTLLNTLLGSDRAIVSHIPGTTRDTIEEMIVLDGIPIRLVDTAGLHESACEIELQGMARTRSQVERAELHLYVIDASQPLSPHDARQIRTFSKHNTILVLNKTDLGHQIEPSNLSGFLQVPAALINKSGISELKQTMRSIIEHGIDMSGQAHAVISERHRKLLLEVRSALDETRDLLSSEKEEVIVLAADRLRDALERLGTVTGRVYNNELLDQIFSRFCIGK